MRVIVTFAAAAAIALAWLATPAAASPLPIPHAIARPEEQGVADRIAALAAARPDDQRELLRELDSMLATLPRPTRMRGLVQYFRSVSLDQLRRSPEARAAVEEAVRLLPGYSMPLFFAARYETYADRPAEASDYLLRALAIEPEIVALPSFGFVESLLPRLEARGEQQRAGLLAQRMLAAGWRGGTLLADSAMARRAVEWHLAEDDEVGARRLLSRLTAPRDVRRLLMQRRFSALWPELEEWGGPRQSALWPVYLDEVRARWRASRDAEAGMAYGEALRDAGHYRTLVAELLPRLMRQSGAERDYELVWATVGVADALARLGRWEEVDALYARAASVWPTGRNANALNITANRASFALWRGDYAAALPLIDEALGDAPSWGGEVSADGLAKIHGCRACALHRLGRAGDAIASAAIASSPATHPVTRADFHLCVGNHDAARAALLAGLEREGWRAAVLAFVQPEPGPPIQSAFGRALAERKRALRADRAVRAAAERYGRIFAEPASAGAPPEEAPR